MQSYGVGGRVATGITALAQLKLTQTQTGNTQCTSSGYKFQFVTLAGFHALNFSMFSLARDYSTRGMAAYADLQVRFHTQHV